MAVFDTYLRMDTEGRRRLKRAVLLRLLFWPLFLAIAFYIGLRRFEFAATWHPVRYDGGADWRLPTGAEDVWFTTTDGVRLHGWFVHAKTGAAPTATVLYAHGNGGNLSNVGWLAERLAARGFDVLVFDYRGYGRSEGAATDERALYADADAAYDYLIQARTVAPERLVLYGQSLGTTAVVDLAARRACAAVIVESGLASVRAMASAVLPWLPRWLHGLAHNRFDSAAKLTRVHCPVLFTHGEPDPVVPTAQGRTLYSVAHEPKRLVVIPGAEHNVAGVCGDAYLDMLADFIRRARTAPQEIGGAVVDTSSCGG